MGYLTVALQWLGLVLTGLFLALAATAALTPRGFKMGLIVVAVTTWFIFAT